MKVTVAVTWLGFRDSFCSNCLLLLLLFCSSFYLKHLHLVHSTCMYMCSSWLLCVCVCVSSASNVFTFQKGMKMQISSTSFIIWITIFALSFAFTGSVLFALWMFVCIIYLWSLSFSVLHLVANSSQLQYKSKLNSVNWIEQRGPEMMK